MESWEYCFNKRLEYYYFFLYTCFLEFVYARCCRWRGLTFVAGFVTPAYPLRIHLQAPFRNRVLTPQMLAHNSSMSAVRTTVWGRYQLSQIFRL